MKKIFSYSKRYSLTLAICCLAFVFQPVQAQNAGSVITVLNNILYSINALVWTGANYMFQSPPNVGIELFMNYTQNNAVKTIPTNIKTLNDQDIVNGLTPNTQNPTANLTQLATIQASDTVLPSVTAGGIPVPFYSSAVQQSMQNSLVQGNENFNFQSLITPIAYTASANQQNNALNYIRFISGYGFPMSNFNLGSFPESQLSMAQKIEIQNSPNYQLYAVQRRQLLAQQSAALTNLYWIYSRRLPIPTIKKADTPLNVDQPSAAQIEEFNATWRTSNPSLSPTWYTQMSVASASNVEREKLFVLAEIQAQLFRMHQDNERMIALMAINQLATLQAGKLTLSLTEKQILSDINNTIKAKARGAAGTATQKQRAATQKITAEQLKSAEQQAAAAATQAATQAEKQATQNQNQSQNQNQ